MVRKVNPSPSNVVEMRERAAKKKKPKKTKPVPVAAVELKADELRVLAAGGDAVALDAMTKIVATFEKWKRALGVQRDERAACAALVGAAEAKLGNAVEEAQPVDAGEDWPLIKLRAVESAWQDLTEAKAEATERNSVAMDRVRKLGSALERAVQDGAQLTIPGT